MYHNSTTIAEKYTQVVCCKNSELLEMIQNTYVTMTVKRKWLDSFQSKNMLILSYISYCIIFKSEYPQIQFKSIQFQYSKKVDIKQQSYIQVISAFSQTNSFTYEVLYKLAMVTTIHVHRIKVQGSLYYEVKVRDTFIVK